MLKTIQQEEHVEVITCKMPKMQGHRLFHSNVRTFSQENWDPKRWDPWDNYMSEDVDITLEEEDLQARPLIQTTTQATREPGDNREEIPRIQDTTMRGYFSTELEFTGRFKQKSRKGIAAWVFRSWDTGRNGIMLNESETSKMALVTAQPTLQQHLYATGLGEIQGWL